MVHQWQFHFGTPGRGRYHNKEWAHKMVLVGLQPSDTGQPGGKQTGDRMDHYIIDGGNFDRVCGSLVQKDFELSWMDRVSEINPNALAETDFDSFDTLGISIDLPEGESKTNRYKYTHMCKEGKPLNVWGKPGLDLVCGVCQKIYEPLDL